MKNIGVIFLTSLILCSCTTTNLREVSDSEKKATKIRALNIQNNDTIYSESLRCYGKQLAYLTKNNLLVRDGKVLRPDKFVFMVNDIKDRTKKIYDGENGISDMLLTSLLKLNYLTVYDYEDSVIKQSRTNFLSAEYPYSNTKPREQYRDLYTSLSTAISDVPVGIMKPADFTISGALTQYDDIKTRNINIDLLYTGYSNNISIADVGIDLRMVYSPEGVVTLENTPNGYKKANFVSLKNRLIVSKDNDGNYFRTINKKNYGISFDYSLKDPKYLAVRETVELATLKLTENLTGVKWEEYCSIEAMDKQRDITLKK